ncbi:MAG TPA: class I SAM-dependent methyltransferase [Dehalococcoidia bacterium]|nr:class I SAM-dependent methyltransferase [Dehalococcoidia bacterium]
MAKTEHRWFAYMWENRLSKQEAMRPWREYTAGRARGRVLEVGIGNGASIPYYRGIDELIGVEPDPAMRRYAEPRAKEAPFPVRLVAGEAQHLPLADDSVDVVVSNLVYCTIPDVDAALGEVARVLKPGGEFRFFEHVRASGNIAGRLQDAVTPLWSWFGAGCHPNRRIEDAIRRAGFDIVEIERFRAGLPHIAGLARPPA